MHVVINTNNLAGEKVSITNSSAEAVRMGFNPSTMKPVDRLKALAAAFISECDAVVAQLPQSVREAAIAKTNMQQASMWAVFAATAGVAKPQEQPKEKPPADNIEDVDKQGPMTRENRKHKS